MSRAGSLRSSTFFFSRFFDSIRYAVLLCLLVSGCGLPGAIAQGVESADTSYVLTLARCIEQAREYSSEAMAARHSFQNSYWRYRTYRADYLPSLRLQGTLPEFNRRIVRYQNPDGAFRYVSENANSLGLALSLEQRVPWTGTSISLQTRLERTDILGNARGTQYLSVPVRIVITHSFFAVNEQKWNGRIEPKRYQEAQQRYVLALEEVAAQTVDNFFEVLQCQRRLDIARLNYANADTLYKIAKGRYNIGTIAENELLQMELNLLNAAQAVNEGKIALQLSSFTLFNYLGLRDDLPWTLEMPGLPSTDSLSYPTVLQWAHENNPSILQYEIQELEAQRGIAQAYEQMGFSVTLEGSYGLTQSGRTLREVYADPVDQQGVRLSVNVPLLDWGKGRGRIRMARSNQELVHTRVEQARVRFNQDVLVEVMRFNMLSDQMLLAAKSDTIAQNRYRITKQRFMIGKVDILELDKAQVDRDQATNAFINTVKNCWAVYYAIRKRTLTEISTGAPLRAAISPLGL